MPFDVEDKREGDSHQDLWGAQPGYLAFTQIGIEA